MSEENSFGYMLKSFRVRKGTKRGTQWSQEQLGTRLDPPVSRITITRWETNVCLPTLEHIEQLGTILELDEADEIALYSAAKLEAPKRHKLFPRNRLFTGREKYLDLIANHFKMDTTVALSGLAGLGKTQLALEYAYRHCPNVYRAVFWVNAADDMTLQSSYADLAEVLRLPERNERELDKRVRAVKRWLERHTNWLLIMDNADDPPARSFFPAAHHGHILLTTRTQIIGSMASMIEIEAMEPAEGLLFLLRRSNPKKSKDEIKLDTVAADIRESALQVVELLDGHPLALDQAGAFIEDGGSFTDYIHLYDKQRHDLLNRRGSLKGADSGYPATVAVTFALCFDKARTQHPLAADILYFCAFLHPDAIPEELFQHDDSFKSDTTAFIDGRSTLLRYSLIKRNEQEQTYSMHRLVQAVLIDTLIDTMSPDLQRQWRMRVVRALYASFPKVEFSNWGQCERLLSHALVCAAWSVDALTPTVGVAELFHNAGIYLLARGGYSEAESLLVRAISIREKYLEAEHPETARCLHNLALLYLWQGKFGQAELLYQRALSIVEKHLGTEAPATASCLHNLALLYVVQGMFGQAEPLLKRALYINKMQLGAVHPSTASSLPILAFIYYKQGKFGQAELLYQRALRVLEKHLGAVHPDIVPSLIGLAVLLHNQGQHEQAGALFQRALSIQEQRLGATHPHTQATKRVYAHFLHNIERDAEAAALGANNEPSV